MDADNPIESRYEIALQAGGVGIWTWSRSNPLITWDNTASEILGIPAGHRLPLEELGTLIKPDDREALKEAIAAAADRKRKGIFELEVRTGRRADEGDRWVLLHGRLEVDDQGPLRLCGAVRDVTVRRRTAELAGQTEARLAAIISIAADAIISVDGAMRISLFNDGAEELFGYRREDIVGEPLDVLIPARFRDVHRQYLADFAHDARASRRMAERSDIFALRKNGEEFPAEASISHVEIAGQTVYTVVMRDVSERRKAINLLATSRFELEQRVAERTAELKAEMQRREEAQAQLARTQRMEAFGQLTGGIAHDFNNLLTVIIGNLELMEMRLEDAKALDLLKRAQDAAEMGARLTSRLLTFARRRQFAPAILDLNEQVMAMVDLMRRTLGEHIDLNTSLAPRLWSVRADPSEIENAVLNLAINARDAMPNGGRLVIETTNIEAGAGDVGTIDHLPAGSYVRLSISDSGVGMEAEILARAFEPFFTTKEAGRGTGLGLSTIYGFAQQSGGTVTINSEPGIGTTVSLYLPAIIDTASAKGSAAETAELPQGKGETILLVEDNAEVRLVARSRLEGLGYRVLEAESGSAALEILERERGIDLVFSDVVMPGGMSGFDLASKVRASRPEVRLLLTSGFAEEAKNRGRSMEVDPPLLAKPYTRQDLARAVRRAIEHN